MSGIETWADPARSLKVFARTQFAFNRTKFPSTAVLFQGSKSPDGRLPKKQVIKRPRRTKTVLFLSDAELAVILDAMSYLTYS